MARAKNEYGLTQQQELFVQEYIKSGIAYKAFLVAYPNSKNWQRDSVDNKAYQLLKKDEIQARIATYNKEIESTLKDSTKLNQHKLLEAALEILEDTRHTPSQYANAINVLKLLYSQQGMMPSAGAQINIQNNIQNNTVVGEVTDYLDL